MAYGSLSVSDLLASNTGQTLAHIGLDLAYQAIDAAMQAHNELLREKMTDLVEVTTDRQRRYGGPDAMRFDPVDEFGRLDVQKITPGFNVGFPLRRVGSALQWTEDFMEEHTGRELAEQYTAAEDADIVAQDYAIRNTIYSPTNSVFVDRLVDNVTLYPKAFINGDGAPIPVGPNGEIFNGVTHTHYLPLAGASLTPADVSAVIKTVTEHYRTGSPVLYINQAQEATIRTMPNFVPYVDGRVRPAETLTVGNAPLQMGNTYNRAIGLFDQAEVWVKPWPASGYMFAFVNGQPKPLCLRERRTGTFGLRLRGPLLQMFPLYANMITNEYGISVWNRQNGAILDATHTGTYQAPPVI